MTAGRPPSTTTSTSRPSRAQQLGDGLGAARHLALVEGGGRDAGDAHELLEVGPHLRHEVGHAVADLLDLVGGEGVVSHEPTLPTPRAGPRGRDLPSPLGSSPVGRFGRWPTTPSWPGRTPGSRDWATCATSYARRWSPDSSLHTCLVVRSASSTSAPGQGTQALRLARLGHTVTAVEPDGRMRATFKQAAAGAHPEQRDHVTLVATDLAGLASVTRPTAYDVVMCHGVLMYLPDSSAAVDDGAGVPSMPSVPRSAEPRQPRARWSPPPRGTRLRG